MHELKNKFRTIELVFKPITKKFKIKMNNV